MTGTRHSRSENTTYDWDGRRLPGRGAVVYDERNPVRRPCCSTGGRCLHHVVGVYEEQETGEVYIRVEDGTHTTAGWIHQDDFWELFTPAGWQFPTGYKPTYHLTRTVGVHDNHDRMLEANRL
jgi:hypothetical protein